MIGQIPSTLAPGRLLGLTRMVVAAVVLVNVAALAVGAYELTRSREHYERISAVTADNLTQVLEKNLAHTFGLVDITLQAVTDEVLRQYTDEGRLDDRRLNEFLARQHARTPGLDSLRFADASGVVRHGVGVHRMVDISGRDYFKRLRDDPEADMVFSEPLIGMLSGKLVVVLARSLRRPDGSFAGVAYGPIALETFRKLFDALDVGPNGVISLRDAHFGVLVRSPLGGANAAMGQRLVSARLLELAAQNPVQGNYVATTPADAVERTFAYRKVGRYPLYVIAGLARQDFLASWRTEARYVVLLSLLFLAATVWGARALVQATTARAKSEESLSLLLESAGDGIFGLSPQGNCTFLNPASLRILGYTDHSQLLGQNIRALVYDANAEAAAPPLRSRCRIHETLRTGLPLHVDDEAFLRADGTPVPVEYWCSPQKRGNELYGAVVTFSDISDRKRAEARLRQSEESFRTVVEHAPLPILVLRDELVRYANAKAAQAFAYPDAQAMQGCKVLDLLDRRVPEHPLGEDRESWDASFETLGHRADGATLEVHVSSTILATSDGPAALAFLQDVTEARQAQARIRNLGQALTQSEEAIALYDKDLNFTYVNPAFTRLFGYELDEVAGKSVFVLRGDDEADNGPGPDQTTHAARRRGSFRGEAKRKAKDGSMVPLMLNVAPLRDDMDREAGFVSVMTDLTELKAAQEKLRQMAHYDSLTGLPNRALLADRLEMGLASAKRQGRSCALLFLDLDHFKSVNDTLGHHTGDLLLKATADLLRSQVRASDTVARLAGDEFVIFLPELEHTDHAALVARKILLAFARPFDLGQYSIQATPSIGVALYPDDAADPAGLIKAADQAMYQAKQAGRNGFSLLARSA